MVGAEGEVLAWFQEGENAGDGAGGADKQTAVAGTEGGVVAACTDDNWTEASEHEQPSKDLNMVPGLVTDISFCLSFHCPGS